MSAVVHLTMTETLRELHIRIPSPPSSHPPEQPAKKKKPRKKKTYKSPYLVPFTFTPESPKHSGIYKDNHRQYPESPYFSYIKELVSCFCKPCGFNCITTLFTQPFHGLHFQTIATTCNANNNNKNEFVAVAKKLLLNDFSLRYL